MQNRRDEKLIEAAAIDACKTCRGRHFWAGIEISTGSIKATCANQDCAARQRVIYLDRRRNVHHWPDEPVSNGPKKKPVDPRVDVPFDRREYILARDGYSCVHCAGSLLRPEEIPAELESLRLPALPSQMQLLAEAGVSAPRSFDARFAAHAARPGRQLGPHAIDHIYPRWATIALADRGMLKERSLELLGQIAAVAACTRCNSERQVPSQQTILLPAANIYISQMMRLFTSRILIDGDVDPIEDMGLFLRALSQLRKMLVGASVSRTG